MSDKEYQEALEAMYVVMHNENTNRKHVNSIWTKWDEMRSKLTKEEQERISQEWRAEIDKYVK